jgi:sigma-B regulation protein RsbU (phosphoserine phosphatase)
MNLRIRITWVACSCYVIVALLLILDGRIREQAVMDRFEKMLAEKHYDAWRELQSFELEKITDLIPAVLPYASRLQASTTPLPNDSGFDALLRRLQRGKFPIILELATMDGKLLFTTAEGALKSPLLSDELANIAATTLKPVMGLALTTKNNPVLAVVSPLPANGSPKIIMALYVKSLESLLDIFAESTNFEAFFVVDGVVKYTTMPGSKPLIMEIKNTPFDSQQLVIIDVDEHSYALVQLPLHDLYGKPSIKLISVENVTAEQRQRRLLAVLTYGFALLIMGLFLSFLYKHIRRAFAPLNAVIDVLNALAQGNSNVTAPEYTTQRIDNDEIGRLLATVETFRSHQQAHNQLLRLRQELYTAAHIQHAILPNKFPNQAKFDLFAELHTAREVGGDFYDFFELPDGRIGLIIADVSDKGIAAALFMATSHAMLRSTALIMPEPKLCLAHANDALSRDNDAAMFVTVFYAVFDPTTGQLVYTNAGHNPPLLLTDKVHSLKSTDGVALGVMEGLSYSQQSVILAPGTRLLLYTDGVTEAINARQQLFSMDRLVSLLKNNDHNVRDLIQMIIDQVRRFAGDTPQSDDITLLALHYFGESSD